ncbi:hypothetical protein J1N35_010603, partial [Gossypium stocksii]
MDDSFLFGTATFRGATVLKGILKEYKRSNTSKGEKENVSEILGIWFSNNPEKLSLRMQCHIFGYQNLFVERLRVYWQDIGGRKDKGRKGIHCCAWSKICQLKEDG